MMIKNHNTHYLLAVLMSIIYALLLFVDGRGGAAELQPLVLKSLDSSYFANDFFVNSADVFNARYYIVKYIAIYAKVFGVNYGLHIVGVIHFIATLLLVYLVSYRITSNEIASMFTMFLAVIPRNMGLDLGEWHLLYNQISANQIAIPVILFGIYNVQCKKYFFALSSFVILSFFHPLLGLEMFSLFVLYLLLYENRKSIKYFVVTVFIFVIAYSFYDVYQIRELFFLSAEDLKKILIDYRHPHHYDILNDGFVGPILFLAMFVISWYWLNSQFAENLMFFNVFFIVIIPLSLITVLIIEYYPLRVFMSAIPFRLLSVIGFLIIIVSMGLVIAKFNFTNTLSNVLSKLNLPLVKAVLAISSIPLLVLTMNNVQHSRLLFLNNIVNGVVPSDPSYVDMVSFTNRISQLTEKHAVIVTPISEIKHMSKRATIEGSQFPFVDKYMVEWYQRRQDIKRLSGSDNGLLEIKHRYSLNVPTYAIINIGQKTKFNKLHCNKEMCLIKLQS